jgi:SagB-type dehydrogenase family enzyme
MRVTVHDIRFLLSGVMIFVAAFAASMGLLSDLWDLNDFVYHKYAAYITAILAMIHVYLHWGRLAGYTRWRLGRGRPLRSQISPSSEIPERSRVEREPTRKSSRFLMTRRDFIELLLGGLGGFALGRFLQPQTALSHGVDVGEVYHEWSKPNLISLLGTMTNWGRKPALYKEYAGVRKIKLPPPEGFRGLSTEESIEMRRSVRDYSGQPVMLEELSHLLYHTGGINAERWGTKLRAAPSAGALYPIEVYVVAHLVEGLNPGLYHYAVQDHALEELRIDDMRTEIVRHGLMQEFLGQANMVIIFTSIFQRLRWKYQERTYRYALLEAGHLGQNVYLTATSMGMGACAVGAFVDDDLNDMLEVDGKSEAAIYMLAVGKV